MRKRSKYKPRAVLVNPLGYVLESLTPVSQHDTYLLDLKIRNHQAMLALTHGHATRQDIDALIAMANIVEALYRMGIGRDYATEVREGLDALHTVARRGAVTQRFVLRANEMTALNVMTELHDAQMEICKVKDIEKALKLIDEEARLRKMRPIVLKGEMV